MRYLALLMLLPLLTMCGQRQQPEGSLSQADIDWADSTLYLYTLTHSGTGMQVAITNFGARVQALSVGGTDVVQGFDTLQHYVDVRQNMGGIVGRYIGRIVDACYVLDGDSVKLQNFGMGDCGHGGSPNFAARLWHLVPGSQDARSLTLRYVSPDGENGFPGELTIDVTYSLSPEGDALRIDYQAVTTRSTVLNPTNHSFFNLTGDLSNSILGEQLWVDSDSIVAYNDHKQATGEMRAVEGTPFDFRMPHAVGDSIDVDDVQLNVTRGYDHCFQLHHGGSLEQPVASLTDLQSGMVMEVLTTEPGLHIYSANGLRGNIIGKEQKAYPRRSSICFETMHYPDSPNKPHWPSTVLRPGQTFRSTTIFRFSNLSNTQP